MAAKCMARGRVMELGRRADKGGRWVHVRVAAGSVVVLGGFAIMRCRAEAVERAGADRGSRLLRNVGSGEYRRR